MADRYVTFIEDFYFRWPGVPKGTAYKAGRTFKVTPMVASAAIKAGKARYTPSRKPPETELQTEKADDGE